MAAKLKPHQALPQSFVDWCQEAIQSFPEGPGRALARMVSDQRMPEVWTKLQRTNTRGVAHDAALQGLATAAAASILTSDYFVPAKSDSRLRADFRSAAAQCRALAQHLRAMKVESEVIRSVPELIQRAEMEEPEPDQVTARSVSSGLRTLAANSTRKRNLSDITTLLDLCADAASEASDADQTTFRPRKHSPTAKRRSQLIRDLAWSANAYFETPIDDALGVLAAVALDLPNPIDAKQLRDARAKSKGNSPG